MPASIVQPGFQNASDNSQIAQRCDNYGNVTVQEFNGRYAELARRGQLFHAQLPAAGQAMLLAATTGGHPTIWNPAGSGKICYICGLDLTWLSGATVAGAFLWAVTKNAGSQIGTAAPVVTFTDVAAAPALIGASAVSSMRYAPTTNTFAAAPTVFCSTGINSNATNGAGYVDYADYNGMIALMPGNAISLCYSVTTSTALFQGSIVYAELPLPVGANL